VKTRNRARLKRQGYRENKGSKGNKGDKRNKTEVWLQKGKNFQGLLVGDRLYIE